MASAPTPQWLPRTNRGCDGVVQVRGPDIIRQNATVLVDQEMGGPPPNAKKLMRRSIERLSRRQAADVKLVDETSHGRERIVWVHSDDHEPFILEPLIHLRDRWRLGAARPAPRSPKRPEAPHARESPPIDDYRR